MSFVAGILSIKNGFQKMFWKVMAVGMIPITLPMKCLSVKNMGTSLPCLLQDRKRGPVCYFYLPFRLLRRYRVITVVVHTLWALPRNIFIICFHMCLFITYYNYKPYLFLEFVVIRRNGEGVRVCVLHWLKDNLIRLYKTCDFSATSSSPHPLLLM